MRPSSRRRPDPEVEAAAFNAENPVGTVVRYWRGIRDGAPSGEGPTTSPVTVVGGHTAAVWIHGCPGFISLSHVEVVGELDTEASAKLIADFRARVAEIELPGDSVAVWLRHRAELAKLGEEGRRTVWKALCDRTEAVGRMKDARAWLRRNIAEESTRLGYATAATGSP